MRIFDGRAENTCCPLEDSWKENLEGFFRFSFFLLFYYTREDVTDKRKRIRSSGRYFNGQFVQGLFVSSLTSTSDA